MLRNAICMSVLLCSIAASLTNFGIVPERAIAAQGASQAVYAQIESFIESSKNVLDSKSSTGAANKESEQ